MLAAGWWKSIPQPTAKTSETKSVAEVLGQNRVARQTYIYPFVSQLLIPASSTTFRKTFVLTIDSESDFECRELYISQGTVFKHVAFRMLYWDEFSTSQELMDASAYETRNIGGPNEPTDLVYPFPASSHAELQVEILSPNAGLYFSAWLKGFKVFK
jgi:hypothetical protein